MGIVADLYDDAVQEEVKNWAFESAYRRHFGLPESDCADLRVVVREAREHNKPCVFGGLELHLSEEDLQEEDLDWALACFKAEGHTLLDSFLDISSGFLLDGHITASEIASKRDEIRVAFEKRLYETWKTGLDLLETLISLSHEFGGSFVEIHETTINSDTGEGKLLQVLVGLHVKACRIASEVLCLLRGGYADGALARWRSLHEISIIALFISKNQGDLPDRYMDHAVVQRWRSGEKYLEHQRRLGLKPADPTEVDDLRIEVDAAVRRYGKGFKSSYGWAGEALGMNGASPVYFSQIETSVEMAHWRPYYDLACQPVHSGAHSTFWNIGLVEGRCNLLAGASDSGLVDPGQMTALALANANGTLLQGTLSHDGPSVDSLFILKVIAAVSNQCVAAFVEDYQKQIARDNI